MAVANAAWGLTCLAVGDVGYGVFALAGTGFAASGLILFVFGRGAYRKRSLATAEASDGKVPRPVGWRTRRIIGCCVLVMFLSYVGSYCVLSAMGGYYFDQTGEVRYSFGFAMSDIAMWHPKYAWYQADYSFVTGERRSRGNELGYFYAPLIRMDRRFIHKTHRLDELPSTRRSS